MFEYQKTHRFFAQIASGMEETGAAELAELQAQQIEPAFCGIYFEADHQTLYNINYQSRLITRILAPLIKFHCYHTDELYKKAHSVPWNSLFSVTHTFAIQAVVSNSQVTHSQYAALRVKDAIVDYFRDHTGSRPSVERQTPDVWIHLHLDNNYATISLDTSGGSLHRRGYRLESVEAPMQETLAAAIVRLTEWDGSRPFYDLMCGSGTLLSEAVMCHCHLPAGFLRQKFGFEFLPDFDAKIWQQVKKTADQQIIPLPAGLVSGSDSSSEAIQATRKNLTQLPGGRNVKLEVTDFQHIGKLENQVIVCNPPYGIRLKQKDSITDLYRALGDFLKQRCHGSTAYIYFGDRQLIPAIGLRPGWKKALKNGPLDGRLAKFEIF
jgi:putative N6-adenine-specific DNA methylase